MKNDSYYRVLLDDYSAASSVSCDKSYYGTLTDVVDLLRALCNDEKYKNTFLQTQAAIASYLKGNQEATHYIAYRQEKLLEPVRLIGSTTYTTGVKQLSHQNLYGCTYYIRFSKAVIQHFWFEFEQQYVRVVKATITDLQYSGDKDVWKPVGSNFWGFPHMIEVNGANAYNRLAVEDKVFESLEEAKTDYENFPVLHDTNYTEFCNDIFGDG